MAAYQVISLILITNALTCIMGQSPHQDQQQSGSCNNVLTGPMGPSGQPGIGLPGVQGPQGMTGPAGDPGSNGIPGVPGQAGLRGEKGDLGQGSKGQTGEPGISSSKGEQGSDGVPGPRGHPGKVGPRGIIGVGQKGDEGQQGVSGDKGESGTSYTAPPMSAFSARKASNQHVTSGNEVITFEAEELDVGNDFNPSTGVFTCRIQGLYYFSFSFFAHQSFNCFIYLEQNGTRKAKIYKQASSGHHVMQSHSVILSLQVGDEVKLTADSPTYIAYSSSLDNIFNGYLFHAT